jgi:lysyl-tRNA synthetase class II
MNADDVNDPTPRRGSDGEDPFRRVRLDKLEALRGMGVDPYPVGFSRTGQAAELDLRHAALAAGTETNDSVRVAGRIRAMRNSGMFIDLHDASGKIQIFSHKDFLSPENLALLRLLDIGDLIGVEGRVRRTPRGELTVNATALTLLAKALRPLPEKYHGLADIELRYRQRYLDLIMNPQSRKTLRRRSRAISAMRTYLAERDYLEVETPMLHSIPSGASAKPFVTHHNALDTDLYLRIAPELHLKRLVVGGLSDKVFEINRCFRNEGLSPRHNPEFTSLELYEAYADYTAMMRLTEEIVDGTRLPLPLSPLQPCLDGLFGHSPCAARGAGGRRPGRVARSEGGLSVRYPASGYRRRATFKGAPKAVVHCSSVLDATGVARLDHRFPDGGAQGAQPLVGWAPSLSAHWAKASVKIPR